MKKSLSDIEIFFNSFSKFRAKEIKVIHKGNNSRVYYVKSIDGKEYVVKRYPHHLNDPRDRLQTEVHALNLINNYLELNIPKVIAFDTEKYLVALSFIKGEKIKKTDINSKTLLQALNFIGEIQLLKDKSEVAEIKRASEACLNLVDHKKHINNRFTNLYIALGKSEIDNKCRKFLQEDLNNWYRKIEEEIKKIKQLSVLREGQLPKKYQILSPSDFGFHNIIKQGSKLFLNDFEYFGWDDPGKLLADFYLQPNMLLPARYREIAYKKICNVTYDPELLTRLAIIYLYSGVKWILILLNPFVRTLDDDILKGKRLQKSRIFLGNLISEFEKKTFPLNITNHAG